MQMPICARCNKNLAVVFITKMEAGQQKNEGLCIKCAQELGFKPLDGLMQSMGMNEEEANALIEQMNGLDANEMLDGLMPVGAFDGDGEGESDEDLTKDGQNIIEKIFGNMGNMGGAFAEKPKGEETSQDTRKKQSNKEEKKRKFLKNYCTDLTAKARNGKIDNIIGREEETRRVIQILNRRQKNNPCLIGEPGVGKTAVAEGLACLIAQGKVPYKLKDKEIQLLDLTSLVAGTQFRGQFESRMKGLIDEVRTLGNIILVIDEVHNLVGAGDAEGAMNAANILKPALSRGEIQVIGATTFAEYRKHIEKDAALERRFQPVTINEPSIDQSTEILRGIKSYYEDYHTVVISDDICKRAVSLSERYITDRFLPDKAIDLIDEACSEINLKNEALTESMSISKELAQLEKEREVAITGEHDDKMYAKIAELKSRTIVLENRLRELENTPIPVLTTEDLAAVIELWTKIPASKICQKESHRLLDLDARMKKELIGQNEAVDAVCAAIRRSRAGVSPKKKPVSFIFVGPTGVGKTELVRVLTNDLFDTPEALIRLDMSEYMEKHAVSRLIGSPPGYVGYDEAGQLTEKVRRKPHSIILFDEIEKAHHEVLNIMLQILDDGRITDAHGRQVSFENTIIIMTSNAGSDKRDGVVGFGKTVIEQNKEKTMKALSEFLRPEFINRIDEIIPFNQLSKEDFNAIAEIMLKQLAENLGEQGISVSWNEDILSYLTEKSYSVKFGARNIRRTIQKDVEDEIAMAIIRQAENEPTDINIYIQDDKITVDVK